MNREILIRKDRMGIMPIGALSIAFTSYIRGVDTFIESGKTHYGLGKKLKINLGESIKEITLNEENYTDNIILLAIKRKMPEVILFSPPNHRLISVLDEVIDMTGEILKLIDINYLESNIDDYIPKFVMLSNGIYYDDTVNHLMKNFKFVDENIREKLIGNFIRATTVQTGTREESDPQDFIFKPGTKGSITIAGGSNSSRERVIDLFKKYDYPVIQMKGEEVRRIEFDKAIFNLSTNGVQLGLVYDEKGFHNFTLGDLVSDIKMQEMCKKIIYAMVSIGVRTGIYKNKDVPQKQLIDKISREMWEHIEIKSKKDNVHIVSSIAIVIEKYRQGKLRGNPPKLPPLEENIVNYLLKLAKENNLLEETKTIEELRDSILHVCGEVACS